MPDHPHFAQRLAAAGYRNGYFGKWHVEGTGKLDDFGWHESDQRCGGAPHKTLPGSELWVKTPGYRNYMLAGASADEGCLQHPAFRPMPLRFAVGNDFVLKLAVVFGAGSAAASPPHTECASSNAAISWAAVCTV